MSFFVCTPTYIHAHILYTVRVRCTVCKCKSLRTQLLYCMYSQVLPLLYYRLTVLTLSKSILCSFRCCSHGQFLCQSYTVSRNSEFCSLGKQQLLQQPWRLLRFLRNKPFTISWPLHPKVSDHNDATLMQSSRTCVLPQLDEASLSIDSVLSLLQTCTLKKDLGQGRRLHHVLMRLGLDSLSFWADHLIRLFVSCERLQEADQVFCRVPKPSPYTWNAIVSAHVKLGNYNSAFRLYEWVVQECGLEPDRVMLLSLLKCCGSDVHKIRHVHHQIVLHRLESDAILSSALIDVNAKCGSLRDALDLFRCLHTKDVISWAALMTGYIKHGFYVRSLELFEDMRLDGLKPDRVVFLCVMKACSHMGSIKLVWLVHDEILRYGHDSVSTVMINTLIDVYGKCGSLGEACKILHGFQKRDAVSWSALVSGCIQHGYDSLVFEYLQNMMAEGTQPSKVTFLCALKASINLVAVAQGWFIHDQILRHGLQSDLEIGNCLIDLYAKFRMPNEAHRVFLHLPKHDLVTWGALVAAYAQVGEFDLVLNLLRDMDQRRLKPNDIIFTSIFSACSCSGLIKEAQMYFKVMIEQFGISPNIQHYSCLIDLFGRSGLLEEAEQFFEIMPLPPDAIAWKSLLNNCKTHGSVHLGHLCFDRGIEMDPEDATNYELLSEKKSEDRILTNNQSIPLSPVELLN